MGPLWKDLEAQRDEESEVTRFSHFGKIVGNQLRPLVIAAEGSKNLTASLCLITELCAADAKVTDTWWARRHTWWLFQNKTQCRPSKERAALAILR